MSSAALPAISDNSNERPGNSDLPVVTVMIATRNRVDELCKTLHSLREQSYRRLEVIVADDASTDGTSEQVRAEFPEVRLLTFVKNRGSVEARNEIIRLSHGVIIIGLDDDSRFIHADAISRVVDRFDREPDLGIISFQAIGPEHPERMTEQGRLQGEWHASSFAACGVAIRKAAIGRTDAFPGFFFHAYEEPDLCLRMWNHGYRVLQWNELIVYHEWSGLNRNERRIHQRHARNEACSVIMRFPVALVVPALLYKLAAQFRYACRRGWRWGVAEPWVWIQVASRVPIALRHRAPVNAEAVKLVLALNQQRVADPMQVWNLKQLSWLSLLLPKCPM